MAARVGAEFAQLELRRPRKAHRSNKRPHALQASEVGRMLHSTRQPGL